MLAPTCSTMISSDEPRCWGFNQSRIQFPLSIGMLLARDSIVGIPIPCSISLSASLFTRSVTHHPVINSVITLCTLWWCPTEWAQRYLSVYTEWKIPVSIRANPTDTFGDTCSAPLWPPSYVVTFGTPKAFLRYPGVAQSHGLRKWYLTLEKL